MEHEERFIVVFTGPIAQADLARSVLDGNGFDTYLADEVVGTWLPGYAASAAVVRVAVPESQAEEARAVLANPENQGEFETDECR